MTDTHMAEQIKREALEFEIKRPNNLNLSEGVFVTETANINKIGAQHFLEGQQLNSEKMLGEKAKAIIEGKFANLIGQKFEVSEIVSILEQVAIALDRSPENSETTLKYLESFRKLILSPNPEILRKVENVIADIVANYAYDKYFQILKAA